MSVIGLLVRVVSLGIVGFIVGGIVGILTWPTNFGIRVPPDAAVPHVVLAGIGGVIAFVAIGLLLLTAIRRRA